MIPYSSPGGCLSMCWGAEMEVMAYGSFDSTLRVWRPANPCVRRDDDVVSFFDPSVAEIGDTSEEEADD
jgi:hypothetical protein